MILLSLTKKQQNAYRNEKRIVLDPDQIEHVKKIKENLLEKSLALNTSKLTHCNYIYRTTNLVSGLIYIGRHYGILNDKYLGSGIALRRDIEIYGPDIFVKEVLVIARDSSHADELEEYHVDEVLAILGGAYNLMRAGKEARKEMLLAHKVGAIWAEIYQDVRDGIQRTPLTDAQRIRIWDILKEAPNGQEWYDKKIKDWDRNLTYHIEYLKSQEEEKEIFRLKWVEIQEYWSKADEKTKGKVKKQIKKYFMKRQSTEEELETMMKGKSLVDWEKVFLEEKRREIAYKKREIAYKNRLETRREQGVKDQSKNWWENITSKKE